MKRRRLHNTVNDIIEQTIPGVMYTGVSVEENLRLRYSPAKDVERRITNVVTEF